MANADRSQRMLMLHLEYKKKKKALEGGHGVYGAYQKEMRLES